MGSVDALFWGGTTPGIDHKYHQEMRLKQVLDTGHLGSSMLQRVFDTLSPKLRKSVTQVSVLQMSTPRLMGQPA